MPDPATALNDEGPRAAPASLGELFMAFTVLALQGFGGVIAIAQRELCERRRWLTAQEFLELLGTAQVLPGPNVCNLSLMIGDRFFGWRGAAVALAGMMTAPLVLMLFLAWVITLLPHGSTGDGLVRGALTGIAAVAAGQIVGTVLRLATPLKHHPLSLGTCLGLVAAAFGMMAWLHWPLVWVLLGLGGATCLLTYAALRRRAA
ncbi:MAG: chromate transporter [Rubrivivax sp.]|nr:MAG: chromate transporter [Rubrivivax sp.]